jgi:hypothetical protein
MPRVRALAKSLLCWALRDWAFSRLAMMAALQQAAAAAAAAAAASTHVQVRGSHVKRV